MMPEVTIQLPESGWPTPRMLNELFANFEILERVRLTTGYGEMVTLSRGVGSDDISLRIVDTDDNNTCATFTTAGGGHVMRRTNLALIILMHAIAMDKAEQGS